MFITNIEWAFNLIELNKYRPQGMPIRTPIQRG